MVERSFSEPVAAKDVAQSIPSVTASKFDKDTKWFVKFGLVLIIVDTALLIVNVVLAGK